MATLNINGQKVTVDDSFLKLSPEDQQTTVDHIAASLPSQSAAPAPDKYQQAAANDIAAAKASGAPEGAGFTRRLAHGATLGADSTLLAGMETPLEMIKRGTLSPAEGYRYAKAREDAIMNDARKNTGMLGNVAELVGGAATGGGLQGGVGALARDVPGVVSMGGRAGNIVSQAAPAITASRFLAPDAGLLTRSLASGADAAALGGVSGFNEGNGLGDRLTKAAQGAASGFGLGAAVPVAGAIAGSIYRPIAANIHARYNPESFGNSQVARAVHESGLTPAEIEQRVQQAAQEGQGEFTVADAMGNPGQEMLGVAARGPGQARTDIVNAMENRQADQSRRVVNAINEGFDTLQTGQQAENALTQARDIRANREYGAARADAAPVDITNVLDHIDQQVAPFGVPHDRLSPDGITGTLIKYRRMLGGNATNLDGSAAGGLNDFRAAQMVRRELSNEAQAAETSGQGPKAAALRGVLRELDNSLENASTGFRQANRNFAQASTNIEQIGEGRTAATRGRPEDTNAAFQALSPEGQYAYRHGMADTLAGRAENAPQTSNAARPLTTSAFRQKAEVMAPNNEAMQRKLGREMTMFDTRATATGGSPTAKNLAHDAAGGVDPHLALDVATGNVHGAMRRILSAGLNTVTGNTPAVRQTIANVLLRNGTNLQPGELAQLVDQTVQRIRYMQNLARARNAIGRGGMVALSQETNQPSQ